MTKRKNLKNRKGQSSVEYILIMAAVVGVIFMFGGQFKERIKSVTGSLFGNVDNSVNQLSK